MPDFVPWWQCYITHCWNSSCLPKALRLHCLEGCKPFTLKALIHPFLCSTWGDSLQVGGGGVCLCLYKNSTNFQTQANYAQLLHSQPTIDAKSSPQQCAALLDVSIGWNSTTGTITRISSATDKSCIPKCFLTDLWKCQICLCCSRH